MLFYQRQYEQAIDAIKTACPKITTTICIDVTDTGSPSLEEWITDQPAIDPDIFRRPDDTATISSTGGTTGKPKGVISTHLGWETKIANFFNAMPRKSPPVHLVAAPMSHAAGAIALMLMAEATTQVFLPTFKAREVLRMIAEEKVTHLFLPPTAIYQLLDDPEIINHDYGSLEYFIYAAAPMSVHRLRECLRVFGPVMAQVFGQVEAPMLCTYLSPEDHIAAGNPGNERRLSSCGRPTLLTPVAIMDDEGNLLPANVSGEIVVRGNLVMPGYYNDPTATANASRYGWHHTGDIGLFDEDGCLYIVDRKSDMIITGGFNVYPSEIEQVIWSHPAVGDCAVVGVPDEKWGEAVKAVIELKPGASLCENEIITLCKAQLGSIKAPKSIEFWDELPRSPVGKVLKKKIREKFWLGLSRRI